MKYQQVSQFQFSSRTPNLGSEEIKEIIVFIDARISNYQTLITAIAPQTKVVIIDANLDGVKQISQTLQQKSYREVHLISHGSPGCLYLGNTRLSLDTLDRYKENLKTWFSSSPHTLLIYGCHVAAGDAGTEFISKLERLTQAKIAASASLTGNAALGGNWELEVTTTPGMDVELAIADPVRNSYKGVLATFTVTTAEDEDDGGVDGTGLSLREAINSANQAEGADTIEFDSSLSGSTITLELGELEIQDSLTINGLGAENLTIDANNKSRVILIEREDFRDIEEVTINGLTITGGNTANNEDLYNSYGGGILSTSASVLNINNSIINGNSADGGGGISHSGGALNITNSTISGNSANLDNYSSGGGISHSAYPLNITNSTISGNSANRDGGGIMNMFYGSTYITNSTISNNSSGEDGGGLFLHGTGKISNSTISGNTAIEKGGGIYNFFYSGNLTLNNSTISNNSAAESGGLYNGLYVYESEYDYIRYSSQADINSTIIAENIGGDLGGSSLYVTGNNNLIGDGDRNGDFIDGENGNIVGTVENPIAPRLGELQDNGGDTKTQALLEDSPAIDRGLNLDNLETDQRGEGFARDSNIFTDIGAFELQTDNTEIPLVTTVTTLEDENDLDLSPDDISLREAILYSEAGDTITFDSSLSGGTITLELGELLINKNLTIEGLGAENITINGNNISRVFKIENPDSEQDLNVVLEKLSITGGNASKENDRFGGGIYAVGANVTVDNATISNNFAERGGGGIATDNSTLEITNSTISDNNSASSGAGIEINGYSDFVSTISDSIISGNSAENRGGAIYNDLSLKIDNTIIDGNSSGSNGGGIFNNSDAILEVNNSTISNNLAREDGGGIYNFRYDASATISNSTISNNSAAEQGGGIYNGFNASLVLNNSTVSGNSANSGGSGIYHHHQRFDSDTTVTVASSIIANNFNARDIEGKGNFVSGGNNLIGNGDATEAFSDGVNGDLVGSFDNPINPQLGELKDNGGATPTQALRATSPAIDAGSNPNNLTTDQRGEGFDRTVGEDTDIGAFERQGAEDGDDAPPIFTVVTTLDDEDDGDLSQGDISLREAIAFVPHGDTITFAPALSGGTITLSLGELVIDSSVSIRGLGADNLTIDANGDSRVFNIDDGDDERTIEVALSGLTITGGNNTSFSPPNTDPNFDAANGGGILNRENLTITESILTGNNSGNKGGGIYNGTGVLTISDTSLDNNNTYFSGGGIYNDSGKLLITNSNISDNAATGDRRSGSNSGGIFNGSGTATIRKSIISNNSAQSDIGGISNGGTLKINGSTISNNDGGSGVGAVSNSGKIELTNSTISGNTGGLGAGGIDNTGITTIYNSTVSNNSATNYGGIHNTGEDTEREPALTIFSSIVANNLKSKDLPSDLVGEFASEGNNLIGNGDDATGFINTDIIGTVDNPVDPKLGELQDNGGATPTQALLPGSIAINNGSNILDFFYNEERLETDQRGAGFARTVGEGTDIGAFEVQDPNIGNDISISTIVTTLDDENDGDVSPGDISLREALMFSDDGDTITFDPSLSGGTIALRFGELAIDKNLTIEGLGADNLTVDANNSSRVFYVSDRNSDSKIDVTLDGLTITGGMTSSYGAGITNRENLTITNSTITGNSSSSSGGGIYSSFNTILNISNSKISDNSGGSGGGIYARDITISNSTINSNSASYGGGGIYARDITISNSTISNNFGRDGGGISANGNAVISNSVISNNSAVVYGGGGIRNEGDLALDNSTINDNSAETQGGSIFNRGNATISNTTISNNSAIEEGGGIYNSYYGTIDLSNSTISGNSAAEASGIYNAQRISTYSDDIYNGTVNLASTIVAENSGDRDLVGDGQFNSGGNNLIGNADGATGFTDGVNGDLVGTTDNPIEPQLGELQDNGGATPTIALLEVSPAIDAGSNPNNLETDQRGEGFNRTVGSSTDIGAFEVQEDNPDGVGTSGDDTLIGSDDNDEIQGLTGNDLILGQAGSDLLNGNDGNDTINGGKGQDTVRGDGGNDIVDGGKGNDELFGDDGMDTLRGGAGDDRLLGDADDDIVNGGDNNDTLLGGAGSDIINGGAGDDVIQGGAGNDLLIGEAGVNVFFLEANGGEDRILDFKDGSDRLELTGGLSFGSLNFVNDESNLAAIIQDSSNNNAVIAVVDNIDAADLTVEDFTNI